MESTKGEPVSLDYSRIKHPIKLNRAVHHFDSVLAKRIYYVILAQIRKGIHPKPDLINELWFDVPTYLLGKFNFYALNRATDELMRVKFEFIDVENEVFNKSLPFYSASYSRKQAVLRIGVNPTSLDYLMSETTKYFWLTLENALMLSSKYSQRWYELFSQWAFKGQWNNVTVEWVRSIFDIDKNKYANGNDFLKRVIFDAIKEINEKSNLHIEYTYIDDRRRPVIGFNFTITQKENHPEVKMLEENLNSYVASLEMSPFEIANRIGAIVRTYGLNSSFHTKLVSDNRVVKAVLDADKKLREGKVQLRGTPEAYIHGTIIRKFNEVNGIKQ